MKKPQLIAAVVVARWQPGLRLWLVLWGLLVFQFPEQASGGFAFRELGERVGCTITFHSLRHFHASLSLEQRQNVVVVSRRLGHASVNTTLETYAHCMPGWQPGTVEAFADSMEADGA